LIKHSFLLYFPRELLMSFLINFKKLKFYFLKHQPKDMHIYHQIDYFNVLEQVDEYCYLGITFHFYGNFKRTQTILCGKALSTI
jgi:hypothetical protein